MRVQELGTLCAIVVASVVTATTNADTLVVLNKEAASASIIDTNTGETLALLQTGDGPHEAAVSPDGRTAVVANYGVGGVDGRTLTVIDLPSLQVTGTIDLSPYGRPHGIVSAGDNERFVVTSETDDSLIVVNVATGEIEHAIKGVGDAHMLALSENGDWAYATAVGEGAVSRSSLNEGGAEVRKTTTGQGTEALAVRPGGEEVWVGINGGVERQVVLALDAETLAPIAEIECGLQPIRIAFTPDGAYALTTCFLTGDLAVIDAQSKTVVRRVAMSDVVIAEDEWRNKSLEEVREIVIARLPELARPLGILVTPDGTRAYVANRGLDHIAVLDLETFDITNRWETGKGPDGMALSPLDLTLSTE